MSINTKPLIPLDVGVEPVAVPCAGVLFDLDGVLVDSMASIERSVSRWADDHGIERRVALEASHGRRLAEWVADLAPDLDAGHEAAVMHARELQDAATVRPCPGALDLLAALPDGAWAIVTSGCRSIATARIAGAGLPHPPVLVTADDVRRSKPDPEGYVEAAARLGLVPSDCLVIEDAPAGVAAALAAGCRVVGVDGSGGGALNTSDLTIASLREVRIA